MLLTMEDMQFIGRVTEQRGGKRYMKGVMSIGDKRHLRDLDEHSVLCTGEHLIEDYQEFMDSREPLTKEDILTMTSYQDVMKTLIYHYEVWDEDVKQHLIKLHRKYMFDTYGAEDVIDDPLPRDRIGGNKHED